MKIKKDAILNFFREGAGSSHEFRELMRAFGVGKGTRLQLKNLVDDLVDEGKLIKLKGNRYGKPEQTAQITGRLATHRDGYGFVTPDAGGEDIFIPARYLRENMHGDRVGVRIAGRGRSGKPEGRIVTILERAFTRVVGTFQKTGAFGYIVPDEQRLTRDLYVPPRRHRQGGKRAGRPCRDYRIPDCDSPRRRKSRRSHRVARRPAGRGRNRDQEI